MRCKLIAYSAFYFCTFVILCLFSIVFYHIFVPNLSRAASINPSEPPESAKAELVKINKRQDDLIRFIRHFEEEQLNPMIQATI